VDAVAKDHRQAGLTYKQVAMLDFVESLSQVPPPNSRAAVQGLKEIGWSEAAILDMTQVAAYYAFVNRIAEGLGVDLEARWPEEIRAGGRSDETP
jgi:alkylhydroperoxidase family enzyme